MKLSERFLQNDSLSPKVDYNHDLDFLGDESSFAFGVEVSKVEASKKFPQIYKFHIGDTGPKTPEPIIDVAIQALKDKQTKYAHFLGYPQVRENIAKFWTSTRGVEIKKENILLEPGGKPAIELSIQALLNKEDQIIVQNPSYPIYASLASFYTHKKPLEWTARQNETDKTLEFEVSDLEKILEENKNIKLLFLNTPQNPTGMMMSEIKLRAIAELAKKYRFMVVFDDIYDQITFDGRKHFSILSVPGMLDYTINLNGCSKNYAMTGWRIGFVVAPEWLIEIFGQLGVNKWSCVSRTNQIVAGTIFGDVDLDGFHYSCIREKIEPILQADFAEYEKKGKFLFEALSLLSPFILPNQAEGAFYLFPNIENILKLKYVSEDLQIKNDKDFSRWLLQEKGFAAIPGSDFGSGGRGYLRLSYAEDRNNHIIPGTKHLLKIIIELLEKSATNPPLSMDQLNEKIKDLEKKYFS
ncbi:MAG: pyridoxal phosphate-dependent aminotransferase [Candidatus Magasanikbacteria bacterium]|nr:pyridoxal phosphate-dependent aminotransferase [Candidatus Magasanikbacteria bacterium]